MQRIGGRQAVGGFGIGACSERRHDIGGLAATPRAVHGVGGGEDRADRGNADRRAAIKESWWRTGGTTTDVQPSRVYICVCVCGACLCEYMCCCMHLSWSVSCYLYVCACACVYLCSHAKPANSWEFASNDLQTSGDIVRASARCRKLWLVSSRLTAGKGRGRCRVVDN